MWVWAGRTAGLLLAAALAGAAPVASASAQVVGPPASGTDSLRLVVDLSERTLEVYEDGAVTQTYEVAVGMPEHPTPTGEFTIGRIIWNPRWVPPDSKWAAGASPKEPGEPSNPMQGVKLFFREPAYYIHGTNDPASIGDAASHGCIRMDPDDAEQLARTVMEHGGAPHDDAWYHTVEGSDETREVRVPAPVSLEIRE